MNSLARQKLCELIAKYGESLCDEPQRCEGLLRDLCPHDRREVHVLANALKARVATDLRGSSDSVPIQMTLARLVRRLEDDQGLSREVAEWAVESWALALGKISATELASRPPTSPSRPSSRQLSAAPSFQQPVRKRKAAEPRRMEDYHAINAAESLQPKRRGPFITVGVIALIAAAAFAGWWFGVRQQQAAPQTTSSPTPTNIAQASPPTAVAPAPRAIATATAIQDAGNPFEATKDHPWVNSLGMKFVPVPGTDVLFSIWDTRVRDYQDFANATKRQWPEPNFDQRPTHPAVNMSWEDAKAFCEWLTERERKEGRLKSDQRYRLPTDAEWSVAVGLPYESGQTPKEKDMKIENMYTWGDQWPPPKGAGNYHSSLHVDEYPYTSPVGSFEPNEFGLYDMCGNVLQWCEDWYDDTKAWRVLRGASWSSVNRVSLLSSSRSSAAPADRDTYLGFRCVLAGGSSR